MKKSRKPENFIRQPSYPGGKKAMDEFVKSNMNYPEDALKNKVEGSVTVAFDIDIYGTVCDAKVKHGIGYGCDEEAVRLVSMLKFEKKKYQGMRVIFHKMINIHFRLHEASKLPVQAITYQYTENKKKDQSPVISYKINIQPD